MVPVPDAAVSVPPVQVVVAPEGEATSVPAGRLSVKSSDVAATVLPVLSMEKSECARATAQNRVRAELLAKAWLRIDAQGVRRGATIAGG